MAGIDKIYGTYEQYQELKKWLKENCPGYLKYMYEHEPFEGVLSIANFSQRADWYLQNNCPLDFVQDRIKDQYSGNPVQRPPIEKAPEMEPEFKEMFDIILEYSWNIKITYYDHFIKVSANLGGFPVKLNKCDYIDQEYKHYWMVVFPEGPDEVYLESAEEVREWIENNFG